MCDAELDRTTARTVCLSVAGRPAVVLGGLSCTTVYHDDNGRRATARRIITASRCRHCSPAADAAADAATPAGCHVLLPTSANVPSRIPQRSACSPLYVPVAQRKTSIDIYSVVITSDERTERSFITTPKALPFRCLEPSLG